MQVEITAEQHVKYSKVVDMSDTEYAEYRRLLRAKISEHERVKLLDQFAFKFGVIKPDNICDADDPQEITVTPIGATN